MTIHTIKSAALPLFARNGYEGTSLAEIANAVGIKTPSLYAHFKSKEDIYLSLVDDVMRREVDFLQTRLQEMADAPPYEQLRDVFQHVSRMTGQNDENLFLKRALYFSPESLQQTMRAKFHHFEQLTDQMFQAIFTHGVQSGYCKPLPIETMLAAYYCLLDGLYMEQNYYDEVEYERRREAAWSVFWLGIQA